jgi:hypothetical protein
VTKRTPLDLLDTDSHDFTFQRLWSKVQNQILEYLSTSKYYSAYNTIYQTKYRGMIMLSDNIEIITYYD